MMNQLSAQHKHDGVARQYLILPFVIQANRRYLSVMIAFAILVVTFALGLAIKLSDFETQGAQTVGVYLITIIFLFLAFSFFAYVALMVWSHDCLLYVGFDGIKHFEHSDIIPWRHILYIREDIDGITLGVESIEGYGEAGDRTLSAPPKNPLRLFGLSFLTRLFAADNARSKTSPQLKRRMINSDTSELAIALKYHLTQNRQKFTERTF